MNAIEKIELNTVDKDIFDCFIKYEDGKYPLGLPTKIQIARKLNEICLFLNSFNKKGNNSDLTRYDCETGGNNGSGCYGEMVQSGDGEYVKFEDIKEFLKPTANTGRLEMPDYLELLKDIDDSRFTVLPGKDSVRTGTRLMYDCILRYFNRA